MIGLTAVQTFRNSGGRQHGTQRNRIAQRRTDTVAAIFAVSGGTSGLSRSLFCWIPVVLSYYMPGDLLRTAVFCERWLSPLLLSSLIQNQPSVSICDGIHGHNIHAKGRTVVGSQSSPSPSLFRY